MRIGFLGDIVCRNFKEKNFNIPLEIFEKNEINIGNLEGPIIDKKIQKTNNKPIELYSNLEVIKLFRYFNIDNVFLANNHITDYQQPLIKTLQELSRNKIKTCGAGTSLNKAKKPIEYVINDQKIAIFGFGWHITDCILAKQNKPGVNPFTYENLFNVYKNYRKNNKQAIILYLFNWNYEMELFPQPAHRKISKELIDIGVDGIIGFHPHIVQGIEVYKNKPIVYGMGNWYLPQEKYQGIKVKFPEISNLELSLDLIYDNGEFKDIDLHWYIFDPKKNKIYYKFSEKYTDSEKIDKLTPFQGMKHKDYKKWFKLNRRKKKFLPIYYEMNSIINNLKDIWVQLRKMIINKLVKLKIHKGSH